MLLPSTSHHPLPPTRFSPGLFVGLQELLYQPCFTQINYLRKIMCLQRRTIFFYFSSFLVWFDFPVLLTCAFYGAFYSFVMVKLRNNNLSHQIMWHNKRIHVLKHYKLLETKFEVDINTIILSYLHHFGDVEKGLFIYCLSRAY